MRKAERVGFSAALAVVIIHLRRLVLHLPLPLAFWAANIITAAPAAAAAAAAAATVTTVTTTVTAEREAEGAPSTPEATVGENPVKPSDVSTYKAAATAAAAAFAAKAKPSSGRRIGDDAHPADHSPPRHRRRVQTSNCGVTGGCATLGSCDDDGEDVHCASPDSHVCEHQLPGVNVCESPPLSMMLPCWMSEVDGALRLNQISIPGTHNTMAQGRSSCLQEGLTNYVQTQAWSLRTMLDAGVRVLDIRLRHKEDQTLVLEHGIAELPYTFDVDVRDVMVSFLSDNPSETIVMYYQMNDLSTTVPAEDTFRAAVEGDGGVYADLWIEGTTVPTLDEARGKIILPVDMPREEQNEYDVQTFGGIPSKKAVIREFFMENEGQSAPGSDGSGPMRLNYFSGSGIYVYPLTVAAGLGNVFQGTNEVVFEFTGGCLGITMFDYIGEDAIAHVVAQQSTTGGPSWDQPEDGPVAS